MARNQSFYGSNVSEQCNLLALLPTALLLAGLIAGLVDIFRYIGIRPQTNFQITQALLALIVLFSFLGYAWFLIRYPSLGVGNTIKATYLIQVFPLLAVLGAYFLKQIKEQRWPYIERIVPIILVVIFLYNLPVLVTHFIRQ